MKLYTVYSVSGDDEWEELRTLDKKEAIEYARNEKDRCKDSRYRVELRSNEIPNNVNYKTFDDYNSDDYNEEVANDFHFGYDPIYFDLDDRLNAYRNKYNLTVPKFAKYLKVPQRTLENWLSGKILPNDITAYAVIDKLERPYHD
jgi:DNA-binding transcriptional regulator YiaG